MADVDAREVVVFGLVEGDLRVSGRVELRDTAVVKGDIVAARLSIEENACMKGKVELLEATTEVSASLPGMEDSTTDAEVLNLS
jgi:cytoskeletal protein CcmA (bactofilin family)